MHLKVTIATLSPINFILTDDVFFFFLEEKPFAWWQPYNDQQTEDGFYMGFKESLNYLKDVMIKEVIE
jgi:hypothetical protein